MFYNQPEFLNYFYQFLDTPKQVIKFYTSSKYILNYFDKDNFEKYFYTPKTNEELQESVLNYTKPNNNLPHISKWNTSLITDMDGLFYRNTYFNEYISDWNTSNVITMSNMFSCAKIFNQELNWNTSNVINMSYMFRHTHKFNQQLNWNVSNVINMSSMFEYALEFDQQLNWDISNVKYTGRILYGTKMHWKINI